MSSHGCLIRMELARVVEITRASATTARASYGAAAKAHENLTDIATALNRARLAEQEAASAFQYHRRVHGC